MLDDSELRARREQAEIDREKASSRRRHAALELEAIRLAGVAAQADDPAFAAEAAAEFHRAHALHEATQGHLERARASLDRTRRARDRAARACGES